MTAPDIERDGVADDGYGSQTDLLRLCSERPKLGVKQTKSARKRTWALECPLLGVKRSCRGVGSDFRL